VKLAGVPMEVPKLVVATKVAEGLPGYILVLAEELLQGVKPAKAVEVILGSYPPLIVHPEQLVALHPLKLVE
jgi:hypothetical protein